MLGDLHEVAKSKDDESQDEVEATQMQQTSATRNTALPLCHLVDCVPHVECMLGGPCLKLRLIWAARRKWMTGVSARSRIQQRLGHDFTLDSTRHSALLD